MQFRPLHIVLVFFLSVLILESCIDNDADRLTMSSKPAITPLGSIDALPESVVHPTDNPYSKEKALLGRLLFYDPILSGEKDVSCATCHHPEFGYAENIELSIGVGGRGLGLDRFSNRLGEIPFAKRNSQTILNTAFNGIESNKEYDPSKAPMFWDLRSKSLEDQSLHPIRQFEEMRGPNFDEKNILKVVVDRLREIPAYQTLFGQAFNSDQPITEENLAKAIACFERTLIANKSRFDLYMRGDEHAISLSEKEGLDLFLNAGCARCHAGPMFSDFQVHTIAAPDAEKINTPDSGFQQRFAFRTPTLRNLRFTAPYMHSGKIQTLENVLTFYEDLRGKPLRTTHVQTLQLDTLAKQIKLEFKDISRILEFLNTLNDPNYDREIPKSVPSGLPVGGNIRLEQ